MTSGANNKVITDIKDSSLVLSPMANLAVNFGGTSLSSTPCFSRIRGRRLSMSSLTPNTPVDSSNLFDTSDSKNSTPRVSRNFFGNNGRGSLIRRMNSAPICTSTDGGQDPGQDGNKENARKVMAAATATATASAASPLKCSSVTGSPLRGRGIENHDSNSRDSGYAAEETSFRFIEPCGFTTSSKGCGDSLKKLSSEGLTPKLSGGLLKSDGKFSFGSGEPFDDGFLELGDLDKSFTDENDTLPAGLGNLLKGPLLGVCNSDEDKGTVTTTSNRPPLRRFNSLVDNHTSPASSRARVGLFRDDLLTQEDASPGMGDKASFKRPREVEANTSKRRKSNSLQTICERPSKESSNSRYKLQRSISETAASSLALMLHKSDLIADFTRPYALPMVSGRHEDLKSITSDTLANLLNGEYSNKVDSFKIIDCRYPYEYEGGHIKGSVNLYTKEQVEQELFANRGTHDCDSPGEATTDERNILIFHCEFSLERGPALYRFLRRCDRNLSSYPSLQYPEVYLLHGGYESFFSTHKSLCEPCSYQPMIDPKHENDLRKFRTKSNSWSGDMKRQTTRSGLKRLGLF